MFTSTLPWHRRMTPQHSRCLGMPGPQDWCQKDVTLPGRRTLSLRPRRAQKAWKSKVQNPQWFMRCPEAWTKVFITFDKVAVPVLHRGFLAEWMQEFSIAGQETRTIGTKSPVLFAKPKLHCEPIQLCGVELNSPGVSSFFIYRGQFLNLLIRCPQWGEANVLWETWAEDRTGWSNLWELGKVGVSKDGSVTNQLVQDVPEQEDAVIGSNFKY